MTEPAVLTCPGCGAPAMFNAPFCTHCRNPLTWGAVPFLGRGKLIARCDAALEELPRRGPLGALDVTRTPQGAQVTVGGRKAVNGQLGPRRRHGCIVVDAMTLDGNAAIGAAARQQELGAAGGYAMLVVPHFRSVNLAVVVSSPKHVYSKPLHAFEYQSQVRPSGQPNEIEIRCADSIVQVFVNGRNVAACVDATFGFGGFCWRVASLTDQPARALVRSVALYDVA